MCGLFLRVDHRIGRLDAGTSLSVELRQVKSRISRQITNRHVLLAVERETRHLPMENRSGSSGSPFVPPESFRLNAMPVFKRYASRLSASPLGHSIALAERRAECCGFPVGLPLHGSWRPASVPA